MNHPVTYWPFQNQPRPPREEGKPDHPTPRPTGSMRELIRTRFPDPEKERHHVVPSAPFQNGELLPQGVRYWKHEPRLYNPQGITLRSSVIILDFDLKHQPDKSPLRWSELSPEQQQTTFEKIRTFCSLTAAWAFYSTNGGFRIVFFLDASIEVGITGAHYRLIVERLASDLYKATGLVADSSCFRWSCNFRLPYPHSQVEIGPEDQETSPFLLEQILEANGQARAELADHAAAGYPLAPSLPGRPPFSPDIAGARAALPPDLSALLDTDLGATAAARNNRLYNTAMRLVRALSGTPYFHEDTIFHLMEPAVTAFDRNDKGDLYLDDLPRQIERAMKDADEDTEDPLETAAGRQALNTLAAYVARPEPSIERAVLAPPTTPDQFITNLRMSWPEIDPEWSVDEVKAWLTKNKRAMLHDSSKDTFHWVETDGFYNGAGTPFKDLNNYVQGTGFPGLYSFWNEGKLDPETQKRGAGSKKKPDQFIDEYTSPFRESVVAFGPPVGAAMVRRSKARFAIALSTPTFERRKIPSAPNEASAKYLRLLFGSELKRAILAHCATAEMSLGPTALIIKVGETGSGKSMIDTGCCNFYTPGEVIDAKVLVADRDGDLLRGGVIVAEESLPKSTMHGDIADKVRQLTTRKESITVNPKHDRVVQLYGVHHRLLISVNNEDKLLALRGHGEAEDPKSIAAIAARFQYFDVSPEAGLFLASNGGDLFTKGWAHEEPFTLLRHMMWELDQILPPNAQGERAWPGGRFGLVPGNSDSRLVRILGGASQDIADKIHHCIALIASEQTVIRALLQNKDGSVPHYSDDKRQFRVNPGDVHNVLKEVYKGIDWTPIKTAKHIYSGMRLDQYRTNKARFVSVPIHDVAVWALETGVVLPPSFNGLVVEMERKP